MLFLRSILVSIGCLVLWNSSAQPGNGNSGQQSRIKVLNADKAKYNEKISAARILQGNVNIEHNGALMFCDSAHLFEKLNSARAYGRVHINQGDTLNLYGDSLYYNGVTGLAQLRGNIRLVDSKMTLTTDSVNYLTDSTIAWYTGGGRLENKADGTVLTSKTGKYFADSRTMYFSQAVKLTGEGFSMNADTLEYNMERERTYFHGPTTIFTDSAEVFCTGGWYDTSEDEALFTGPAIFLQKPQEAVADTIFYNKEKGEGKLYGHVQIKDTAAKTLLTGEYSEFRQADNYAMMTKKALFVQYAENDTLYLHADTLLATEPDSGQRLLRGYYHVRFYKRDFQGMCDSMSYNESDSILQLFGEPVLWNENNQLTADTIRIYTRSGEVFKLQMRNASFIIQEYDTVGFNQIKGRDMDAFFRSNELRKIVVTGNGQSIYYAGEEGKKGIGLNRADCSDILIYLDTAGIKTISFLEAPEARLIPMKMIQDDDRLLSNFKWFIEDRPYEPMDVFFRREEGADSISSPDMDERK